MICCCSPCREELTVTVLSPLPAQGFCSGRSRQIEPGKAFRKEALDRPLLERGSQASLCLMGSCRTNADLQPFLLAGSETADSLLFSPRGSFPARCSVPCCDPPQAQLAGTEMWLLMQCVVGTSLAVAQKQRFPATDNLRYVF